MRNCLFCRHVQLDLWPDTPSINCGLGHRWTVDNLNIDPLTDLRIALRRHRDCPDFRPEDKDIQ